MKSRSLRKPRSSKFYRLVTQMGQRLPSHIYSPPRAPFISNAVAVVASIVTLLVFIGVAKDGYTATVSWTDTTGFWDVASNWSSNPLLPTSSDDVTINVAGVQTITHRSGNDTIRSISNDEILTVTGGSLVISGGAASLNTGTLRADGATLQINGLNALTNTGGTIDARNNGTVIFNNAIIAGGTLTGSTGGTFSAQNISTLVGVTLDSGAQVNVTNTALQLQGTTTNNGAISLDGADIIILGPATIGGSGTVTLNNGSLIRGALFSDTLTNGAGHTIQGSGQIGQNAMGLNNQGLIVANQSSPLIIDVSSASGFTTQGVVRVNSGSSLVMGSGDNFTQTAGTTVVNGVLNSNGGVVTVNGGVLQGNGSITGNVVNNANVAPGNSPGLLTVNGNYTQSSSGHLLIELAGFLAGTNYDVLDVHGNATLGGFLDVGLFGSFDPTSDEFFDVLLADGLSGTFDTVNLPTSPNGVFSVSYLVNPTGLDAVRISFDFGGNGLPQFPAPTREGLPPPGTQVPEPSAFILLLFGIVALTLMRQRRRKAN